MRFPWDKPHGKVIENCNSICLFVELLCQQENGRSGVVISFRADKRNDPIVFNLKFRKSEDFTASLDYPAILYAEYYQLVWIAESLVKVGSAL